MIPIFLSGIAAFYLFQYFPFLTVFLCLFALVLMALKGRYVLFAFLALGLVYAFIRYSPEPERVQYIREAEVSGFFKAPAVRRAGQRDGAKKEGFSQDFHLSSNSGSKTPGDVKTLRDINTLRVLPFRSVRS